MKNKNLKNQTEPKQYQIDGHSKPTTRRQFLAQTIGASVGSLMAPSLFSLIGAGLSQQALAQAANCPIPGAAPGLIPFMSLDLAGGAAISGNFVTMGPQGSTNGNYDLLSNYNLQGIPYAVSTSTIDTRFGAPMHTKVYNNGVISKMYEGLDAILTKVGTAQQKADLINKISIVTICHFGQDDTSNNPLNPNILVTKAGLHGKLFSSGLGTSNSSSGGYSQSPIGGPGLRPAYIPNVDAVIDSVKFGPVVESLPPQQKQALAKVLRNLTSVQKQKVASMTLGQQMSELVECGYLGSESLAVSAPDLDPRKDANLRSVWGLVDEPETIYTEDANRYAGIVNAVLRNYSGPGCITLGGNDYHTGAQTDGDRQDRMTGEMLGRIILTAHKLGKPVAIACYSDGACSSDAGTRNWTGDTGSQSLAFMTVYNPNGKPTVRNNNFQIGHYTAGQIADRSTFFGPNPDKVAYIFLANYLELCGRQDLMDQLIPQSIMTGTQRESILRFNPLA